MNKRLILVLALAFLVGITCAAYAEVQNVKVSGDITAMGVIRDNFDLTKTPGPGSGHASASNYDDKEKDLLSITRVRVDADLTDNVTATIRLLNERNWNGDSTTVGRNNVNVFVRGVANSDVNEENQLDLDLAYVTLKEFLYSPLTLRVGRQELHFNNDFIIGDPDTNMVALKSSLAEGDLSARKSFDSLRATLDYNPLVVDVIFAKLAENDTLSNDDTTLYGLNLAYELDKNTTLEGYYWGKYKGSKTTLVTNVDSGTATAYDVTVAGVTLKDKTDTVNTVGARVVNKTVSNLTVDLQGAFQFGTYNPKFDPNARYISNTNKAETANRRAWALEALLTYDLKDIKAISKYSPSISAAYAHLSGADRDRTGNKDYKGWDSMFENQTFGHIINAIMAFSNANVAAFSAKAKPVEDVTVKFDGVWLWLAKKYPDIGYNTGVIARKAIISGVDLARQFATNGEESYIGQEYDLTLTYDYTEDVQFALLGGVFVPGKVFSGNTDNAKDGDMLATAGEVIGSMKVTF